MGDGTPINAGSVGRMESVVSAELSAPPLPYGTRATPGPRASSAETDAGVDGITTAESPPRGGATLAGVEATPLRAEVRVTMGVLGVGVGGEIIIDERAAGGVGDESFTTVN